MKDVFLFLAGHYGHHSNQNVEYGGPALPYLSMSARQTLTTMSAELSAEFAIFEPDDVLFDHLSKVTRATYDAQYPDPDVRYLDRRIVDLGAVGPRVALPDAVINNTVKVEEAEGTPIQQAYLGSCANGMLEDLQVAAEVVKGRTVSPGVRFIVAPASQKVYRDALKAGYIGTLLDAGAIVTSSTCGACGGFHGGLLGPTDTCITTSTRNFKGRMGDPNARIYMGSPATVAAAAIAGAITHPGNFMTAAAA
jgi:3-isopropylmalate/(R)-2-methylmalate dehydratase large subunit